MQQKVNPNYSTNNFNTGNDSILFNKNLQLENNFICDLKTFKIKKKVKNTNYNMFTYKHPQNPFIFPKENSSKLSNNNCLFNYENFLCTSFYCEDTKTTKILIENLILIIKII